MIGTGRTWAILFLAVLLAQRLSSATPPSCAFSSNSADQAQHGDVAHHSHDHDHSPDHGHHSHELDHDAHQGHHDDHAHHSHDHEHDHAHHSSDHVHAHHAHDHDHDHSHGHGCKHDHHGTHSHTHQDHAASAHTRPHKLPEELAEEEELRTYGFKSDVHVYEKHLHKQSLPSLGLWMRALGCSLLVSMASLICLILLPLIVAQGKPSRVVVDFLAAFGAGAMLGDAFLHQLPHAFGGSSGHSHSHGAGHDHAHLHANHNHGHSHEHHNGLGHSHTEGHGHAHSIQDLSVGLAVLAGIILFFIVEKIVRQVEKASLKGALPWAHNHHHHHHHHHQHEHDDDKQHQEEDDEKAKGEKHEILSKDDIRTEDTFETNTNGSLEHKQHSTDKLYRRKKTAGIQEESETTPLLPEEEDSEKKSSGAVIEQIAAPNLILGYLNLFSDGVHNFTDGMALGAAFLNHGTLGGWSRTLFLLAHELPQEVGDFGILVQSGFSVLKALAFNFLSALTALLGTAVALLLGGNPGHSSLIEGFTAGGFIYIAVAGVLPEMHQHGTSTKTTCLQLLALSLGMSIALSISLVE